MKVLLFLASTLILFSCGSINVQPVQNGYGSYGIASTNKTKGVRYYRPAPHIWIINDVVTETGTSTTEKKSKKGMEESLETRKITIGDVTYKSQMTSLPDYSQEYIITWKRGLLGSVSPKFALADGWSLTGFESEINSGLTAGLQLTGALSKGVVGLKMETEKNWKGPGLYKLEFDVTTRAFKLGTQVIAVH